MQHSVLGIQPVAVAEALAEAASTVPLAAAVVAAAPAGGCLDGIWSDVPPLSNRVVLKFAHVGSLQCSEMHRDLRAAAEQAAQALQARAAHAALRGPGADQSSSPQRSTHGSARACAATRARPIRNYYTEGP